MLLDLFTLFFSISFVAVTASPSRSRLSNRGRFLVFLMTFCIKLYLGHGEHHVFASLKT